jgi:hypothetical protein
MKNRKDESKIKRAAVNPAAPSFSMEIITL